MQPQGDVHLGILGATGRTGRPLVAAALAAGHRVRVLARQRRDESLGPVEWHEGDVLDAPAMDAFVVGLDAVVCVLGPSPSGPADVCSRATENLVRAMREARAGRLVVVTGALIGHPHLGRFYRFLRSRAGLRASLTERGEQERIVQESGLDYMLVRPPQLTEHASRGHVLVGADLTIRMRDSVPRAQLAQVLLALATGSSNARAVTVVDRFGIAAPSRLCRAWLLAMGVGELLGIALTAVVTLAVDAWLGPPSSLAGAIVRSAFTVLAGTLEGFLLGAMPALILRDVLPELCTRRFVRNTTLVAAVAWIVGMTPSTLLWNAAPQAAGASPSWSVVLAMTAGFGLLGGALIGLAQWLAMKGIPGRGGWILATAIGWSLALPLDFAGAMLPTDDATTLTRVLVAAGFALAAGCVVALPTGGWLLHMARKSGAGTSGSDATR